MRAKLLLGFILMFCFTAHGIASEGPAGGVLTKPSPKVQQMIDDFQLQVVDFDYVKQAVGKGTRKGAKALMVDARPNAKYIKGTIPSSINLPDNKFEEYYGQFEDMDKAREVIVFCGGWQCAKSPKVANMLQKKGFANVKIYPAGEPDWKKNAYSEVGTPVIQAAHMNNSAVIIDARPYKKYLQATIPGAISIPDTDMEALAGRFPVSQDEKIIVFCGGYDCGKSHTVAKTLQSLGYKNVTVYAGGLPQWQEDGLATTASAGKKPSETPEVEKVAAVTRIPSGLDEGTIDGEWFKSLVTKKDLPENIQLIAVVPPEDFQGGYLEGAVNIYADPLKPEELYEKLPKDKVVVFCCTSGSRALEAWYKLSDAKLDTSNIYYFDANINCEKGSECKIEVHEPLG